MSKFLRDNNINKFDISIIFSMCLILMLNFVYFNRERENKSLTSESVAFIMQSQNEVKLRKNEVFFWSRAKDGDAIANGEMIFSGNQSNVSIMFIGDIKVELGENTILRVLKPGKNEETKLQVNFGSVKISNTSKIKRKIRVNDSEVKLEENTILESKTMANKIEVKVIEGRAQVDEISLEKNEVLKEQSVVKNILFDIKEKGSQILYSIKDFKQTNTYKAFLNNTNSKKLKVIKLKKADDFIVVDDGTYDIRLESYSKDELVGTSFPKSFIISYKSQNKLNKLISKFFSSDFYVSGESINFNNSAKGVTYKIYKGDKVIKFGKLSSFSFPNMGGEFVIKLKSKLGVEVESKLDVVNIKDLLKKPEVEIIKTPKSSWMKEIIEKIISSAYAYTNQVIISVKKEEDSTIKVSYIYEKSRSKGFSKKYTYIRDQNKFSISLAPYIQYVRVRRKIKIGSKSYFSEYSEVFTIPKQKVFQQPEVEKVASVKISRNNLPKVEQEEELCIVPKIDKDIKFEVNKFSHLTYKLLVQDKDLYMNLKKTKEQDKNLSYNTEYELILCPRQADVKRFKERPLIVMYNPFISDFYVGMAFGQLDYQSLTEHNANTLSQFINMNIYSTKYNLHFRNSAFRHSMTIDDQAESFYFETYSGLWRLQNSYRFSWGYGVKFHTGQAVIIDDGDTTFENLALLGGGFNFQKELFGKYNVYGEVSFLKGLLNATEMQYTIGISYHINSKYSVKIENFSSAKEFTYANDMIKQNLLMNQLAFTYRFSIL